MATIIDMFTRQPIKEPTGVGGSVANENDQRSWFMQVAREGPENLSRDDQTEWIILFHQYYLAEFLDAAEGIRDATEVADLEHFMGVAVREMKKWPKS